MKRLPKHGVDIWNQAFMTNWDGDLALLPINHLPDVKTSLDIITLRTHYKQLCELRPDLCKLDFIQNFYDDGLLWGTVSTKMMTIVLPEVKLITLAAWLGHSTVVQSLLQDLPIDTPKLAEAATISLNYAATEGYSIGM
ncbi:hypothetical protein HDU76_006336 [Blyttiomyces sp. JEL0837]|nr:hypothetical protein HDU76_006336 [Blyttiomyces sp. JEL0837]